MELSYYPQQHAFGTPDANFIIAAPMLTPLLPSIISLLPIRHPCKERCWCALKILADPLWDNRPFFGTGLIGAGPTTGLNLKPPTRKDHPKP